MSMQKNTVSKEALKLIRKQIESDKSNEKPAKKDFDIKRAAELMAGCHEDEK